MTAFADELDTTWLARLLKKSYHDSKPTDLVDLYVEQAAPNGNSFVSSVLRVKIKMMTASGSKKTFSVIVKQNAMPAETKKLMQAFEVFRNEIKILTTVIPRMEDLMEEFNDKREKLWPNIYGYLPYRTIVLEDLKENDYLLVDRTAWQDLDCAMLVLRSLGRYHAMTKVLMGRRLIGTEDRGRYFLGADSILKRKLVEGAFHMLSQAMINSSGCWKSGWEELGKRVEHQIPVICHKLECLYNTPNETFDVLNHGDLWSSNIMFKVMEYTGQPTSLKFLDFQLPHVGSFIWDVTHYMYSSVLPSVRRANKDTLLRAYHQSLSDNLNFFRFDGYIPTMDDVTSEATRVLPAALAVVTSILPIATATTNKTLALEELQTSRPEEAFDKSIFDEEKFVREISDDIKDFASVSVI